ncbi:MAG: hypothetical protein FJ128_05050 [Deltaproteobacteria bacterium]|nr:hypothetical protein [Deltaproteobacteria bacterium]
MRVLAITKDTFILRQVRLAQPLLNLRRQGLVADFWVTDPTLFDVPQDFVFNAVWVQKVDDAGLLEHLAERLEGRFLYDLDDNLLARAAYRGQDLVNREGVKLGVRLCGVLAVTSARLAALLERYAGVSLEGRVAVCPNGGEFQEGLRAPAPPRGLLFTSSDALALTSSAAPVLSAVGAFARRHRLPIYCFGWRPEALRAHWPDPVYLGLVPYWHYQALLASLPACVGIAPLETAADPETLDFINGKSDVKMVEFGGHGHPAVYSQAPPYADTDLAAGMLAPNTREAWEEALEEVLREGWRRSAEEQARVRQQRHMNRIARECWHPALARVRLPRPMRGARLKPARGLLGLAGSALRHLVYQQDYRAMKRLQARLPDWVRNLARRWY